MTDRAAQESHNPNQQLNKMQSEQESKPTFRQFYSNQVVDDFEEDHEAQTKKGGGEKVVNKPSAIVRVVTSVFKKQ